jgi:hypothetical protein
MARIGDLLRGASRLRAAYNSMTAASNVSTAETDLLSTTIPAATLVDAGDVVRIRAWGTTVSNANVKTVKLYFGTVTIASQSLTASQAGKWVIEANVVRTAKDTQEAHALIVESVGTTLAAGKHAQEITALTQDEDASITVKVTGTSGTASADVVQEGMLVVPLSVVRG